MPKPPSRSQAFVDRPPCVLVQHVNKTESAIRLTHTPTGITVSMQDSRSQHENRTKAYRVLRARLMDRKLQAEVEARRSVRRGQVKGADRSEKIRTYNFPQVRDGPAMRSIFEVRTQPADFLPFCTGPHH